ncbi:MAG TPA: DUF1570 domain-containing protein, partial [Planctomycetota bacterium]|nr:DUF1570 domain-containing protein [Planctomycetota bacterium]
FPKISKEKRKFTILVYANDRDYHAAGGPKQAAGHYDPLVRNLNIYKDKKEDNTLSVLYHEGFHQYIHDYLEQPPQWWNEGLGDFFGGARHVEPPKGHKVTEIRLLPFMWRLPLIQQAIRAGRVRHFKELMLMSQQELYDPQWAGIHYAESWSIIYFLIRGDAGRDSIAGPYFKLLGDYFKALRKGEGQEGAFEAAFGKCDLPKLEEAWRRYILSLTANG